MMKSDREYRTMELTTIPIEEGAEPSYLVEGYASTFILYGKLKASSVARAQKRFFTVIPAVPDWTYSVDDILRLKIVSPGYLGISRLTAVKSPAFFEKLRTCSAVNRPVNSAASEKRAVSRVYYRITGQPGDVAFNDKKGH